MAKVYYQSDKEYWDAPPGFELVLPEVLEGEYYFKAKEKSEEVA